jgi:hypothetical protein
MSRHQMSQLSRQHPDVTFWTRVQISAWLSSLKCHCFHQFLQAKILRQYLKKGQNYVLPHTSKSTNHTIICHLLLVSLLHETRPSQSATWERISHRGCCICSHRHSVFRSTMETQIPMLVLLTVEACFNSAHMWTLIITVTGLQEIQYQSTKPHYTTLRLACCGLSPQLWLMGPIFPFWDHKFTSIHYTYSDTIFYTLHCLEYLSGNKIISRGLWPPHSPELNLWNFFLWGTLKNRCITTYTLMWYYKTFFY